jgi:RNA polymerase sigma factor (sigma-70 family)
MPRFFAWLRRIAAIYLKHERDKRRKSRYPEQGPSLALTPGGSTTGPPGDNLSGDSPTASWIAMSAEEAPLIQRALDELPEPRRLIVQMVAIQGESYAAIARLLGCDESKVRYHFNKGLKQLAPKLMGLR